jgi:hypothetical protein
MKYASSEATVKLLNESLQEGHSNGLLNALERPCRQWSRHNYILHDENVLQPEVEGLDAVQRAGA